MCHCLGIPLQYETTMKCHPWSVTIHAYCCPSVHHTCKLYRVTTWSISSESGHGYEEMIKTKYTYLCWAREPTTKEKNWEGGGRWRWLLLWLRFDVDSSSSDSVASLLSEELCNFSVSPSSIPSSVHPFNTFWSGTHLCTADWLSDMKNTLYMCNCLQIASARYKLQQLTWGRLFVHPVNLKLAIGNMPTMDQASLTWPPKPASKSQFDNLLVGCASAMRPTCMLEAAGIFEMPLSKTSHVITNW